MNPCAAFAMLTARSPSFPRLPRGHGGLTREDVAAMLVGMDKPVELMGYAYELGDKKAIVELHRLLWWEVIQIGRTMGWRRPRPRFICRQLAMLALYEALEPYICPQCNGKGSTTFDIDEHPEYVLSPYYGELNEREGRIRCLTCRGAGRIKLSGRKRADIAGVSRPEWQEYWSGKYEGIYALTKGWLSQARDHLGYNLKKNNSLDAT